MIRDIEHFHVSVGHLDVFGKMSNLVSLLIFNQTVDFFFLFVVVVN